ncbi:unnamed protein product [Closterium sp. NIES-53]
MFCIDLFRLSPLPEPICTSTPPHLLPPLHPPSPQVYTQFVNVSKGAAVLVQSHWQLYSCSPIANEHFFGFCIDLFRAAVAVLPYPSPFPSPFPPFLSSSGLQAACQHLQGRGQQPLLRVLHRCFPRSCGHAMRPAIPFPIQSPFLPPLPRTPPTFLALPAPPPQVYKQFVNISKGEGKERFSGFCIDVFRAAVAMLPYPLDYEFVQYGEENVSPSYNQMVLAVADKVGAGCSSSCGHAAILCPVNYEFVQYGVENVSPSYNQMVLAVADKVGAGCSRQGGCWL